MNGLGPEARRESREQWQERHAKGPEGRDLGRETMARIEVGQARSTRGLAQAIHGSSQIPHGQAAIGLAGEQVAPGPGAQAYGTLTLQHCEGSRGRAIH